MKGCETSSPTLILCRLSGGRYVLKELIETEKHYVADLGLIVEVMLTHTHTHAAHTHTDANKSNLRQRSEGNLVILSEPTPNPYHHNSPTSLHTLLCHHPTVCRS